MGTVEGNTRSIVHPPLRAWALCAALVVGSVGVAQAANQALTQAAATGAQLFASGRFGGTRDIEGAPATCETCHRNGGRTEGQLPDRPMGPGKKIPSLRNAAAIFPRYRPEVHRVITLSGQIQHCVVAGLQGKAPADGSPSMVAMEAYLASIAHGQKMDPGGKPR